MTALGLLVVLAAGVAVLYLRAWLWLWNFKLKSKKFNCQVPLVLQDKTLGIVPFSRILNASRHYKVLQTVRLAFDGTGKRTLMTLTLGRWTILTIEPENVKAMLATDFKSFGMGHRHGQLSPLLGDGIFTSEGEPWRHSRTMLRPQFSRERISRLQSLETHVSRLLQHFTRAADTDQYIDSQLYMHRLTLDSASSFLFGVSVDTLAEGLDGTGSVLADKIGFSDASPAEPVPGSRMLKTKTGMKSASDIVNSMEATLAVLSKRARAGPFYWAIDGPAFRRQVAVCHDFVDQLIEDTIARKPAGVTLEQLEAQGADLHFIEELSYQTSDRKFMRDQAFTILLAGRDTTSALLSFCMYHLTRHPDVYAKLRAIVVDMFGTQPGDHITFESLKRCKYITAILNETLRITPVVPLNAREAKCDTTLPRGGGPDESQPLFVPKGTQVVWNIQLMHRLPDRWGPDSETWNPARWEDPSFGHHSWDFVPFNGGPRICLGQQFALTEAAYTLLRIAQTFSRIETRPDLLHTELLQRTNLTTIVAGGVPTKFYY